MTTSKIQAELAKATEVTPEKGETIKSPEYIRALMKAISKLSTKDWDALSGPAQDWFNSACDAVDAKKDIPAFPDAAEEEETSARRRRGAADDAPAAAKEREPKKGDKVRVTTKRGAVIEGTVTIPNDDGELVLDDGSKDGEVGLKIANIEKIEFTDAPAPEPETTGRRRKAADDEPAGPADPAVGDTVQIETARGTIKMGNVVEINDEIIVIKEASGDETEFDKAKLKSVTVKVAAKKDEPTSGRRRAAADDAAPESGRRRGEADAKGDDGKDSKAGSGKATLRARELILDNLDWTKEQVIKGLKKEFPDAKENTINLIYGECHKIVDMLKARKMLK